MADIFLVYAHEDRETARKIGALLESAGWSVWWDRSIPKGEVWRDHIDKALLNMRCMVVLWTARSVESDWVKEEAEEARAAGKLVPVLLEAIRLPVGFRTIQPADLVNWDGSGEAPAFRQLVSDLQAKLGKSQSQVVSKGKVFISYSRNDTEFASKLAKSLRAEGIQIWMDQLDIPPGAPWDRSVEQALESSGSLLVILSPHAVDSENVRDEISAALESKKDIVPLLYRPCVLPYRLRRLQYIDFSREYESALGLLVSHLERKN